jgi:acetyl esterase/lipase
MKNQSFKLKRTASLKKIVLPVVCFAMALVLARAQTATTNADANPPPSSVDESAPPLIPLWDKDASEIYQHTIVDPLPGKPGVETGKITVTAPSLQIFSPPRGQSNGIGVIICPGGSYHRLFVNLTGTDYAHFLVARGYTGAILRYRMPQPIQTASDTPYPVVDAQRAIQLLRSKAAELGLNPNAIGIWGGSAGGHLAATCTAYSTDGDPTSSDPVARQSSKTDFLILSFPITSTAPGLINSVSFHAFLGSAFTPERLDHYSIEKHVNLGWPPTFIVQAMDDPVHVQNSIVLIDAIHKVGGSVEAFLPPKGGHGFPMTGKRLPSPLNQWPQKLSDWLQSHVLPLGNSTAR